jgi:uncharacterized membrane protein YphA (DoxX/SURF4 family)
MLMEKLRSLPLYRVLCVVVGLVFAITGISKAINPAAFLEQLSSYQMVPIRLLAITALLVILIELTLGALLLLKRWTQSALILTGLMTVAFLIVIAWAWQRGLQIDCGCLIGVSERVGPGALIRDSVLLAVIVWAWIAGRREQSRERA